MRHFTGCSSGETCEYLHEKDVNKKEHTEVKYMVTQTENNPGVKEKETQTPKVKKINNYKKFENK